MNNINSIENNIEKFYKQLVFQRVIFFSLLFTLSLLKVNAQSPDIHIEDITFESSGVTLAGTIYTPRQSHGAVVIVHGSDPTPRMEKFAALLAENGITALTYDKRGVGQSGGIYVGPEVGTNNVDPANLDLLAQDASAAVNELHQRDKNAPIGLVGFSQAGWIIPIAANKNPLVNYMVIFCGSVVPTLEQLRFQFFTEGKPDFWDNHTENQVREHIRNATDRYQFENTDPYTSLSSLSIPGIWLWGGRDEQVPVGLSIERINKLKVEGKPYEYYLFPTLGHNVAFGGSTEPIAIAIQWIKDKSKF